jgi:hypothetical protein
MSRTDDARPRRRSELTGVTRTELKEPPWVSPHHGYHRDAVLHDPVRQRILDAAAVMPPGAAVGGWAAAYLHGATYLDGRGDPVLLLLPANRVVDRPGIEITRVALEPDDLTTRHGISCTSGTRTAFDLLRRAPDLTEAVVAGDGVVRAGLTTIAKLAVYASGHPRRRGLRQLRAAVPLLEPAAASPPETRLRMLCRQQANLPRLLVNVPVYDAVDRFLGIPDLLEPVTGLVIEYDGEQHRELGQHTADNLREEGFEAAGLGVVRVTSLDLDQPAATASRISAAYQRRLGSNIGVHGWSVGRRYPGAA